VTESYRKRSVLFCGSLEVLSGLIGDSLVKSPQSGRCELILAMQFNSFLHPLTVMLALPLSTVGAFGALYVTGDMISIICMIGMITLTALVVKNSILLVDYTNTLRERGMERNQAVLQATPVRLRPILMTAVTTMLGVLPVAYTLIDDVQNGMRVLLKRGKP
jgi:HAE1 family hydrophobic/amphiphilic exporter-1